MQPWRDNPKRVNAVNRAIWTLSEEIIPLNHVIRAADTAIAEYQRGDGVTDPRARDMFTHPDMIEAAEMLAERIRVMLFEDEELADKIPDLACEFARIPMGDDDFDSEAVLMWEDMVTAVLHALARPMILRVLDTGDWNADREEDD